MKKSLYIICTAISIFLASCGKSFLEKYPVGQVPKEQMFQDVGGMKTGLNGAYSLVAKYHMGNFGMLGDLRGDDVKMNPSSNIMMVPEYNYQVDVENNASYTSVIWRDLFEALNNTNNVINASSTLRTSFPLQSPAIDSLEGQALVLRALINFNLSQSFSQHYTYTTDGSHMGMPVLFETPFPGTPILRKTIKETYAQIIDDLNQAIVLLKNHNNKNQVTASLEGAYAFLSRIYLYMENWEEARKYANMVLESNRFSLVTGEKYADMFTDPAQRTGARAPEVIWQLNLFEVKTGYLQSVYSDPDLLRVSPATKLLNLYEDGDIRKAMYTRASSSNQMYTLKYALPSSVSRGNWPVNYKVFRLAEVYLNRAEANWHLKDYTEAENDLKRIIARAFETDPSTIVLSHTNPNELLELIKNERRKELAFEGHRIYDITRYKEVMDRGENCGSPVCLVNYPNNLFVLPIPRLELDANPQMQQNPGF